MPADPRTIADRGNQIYAAKFQKDMEHRHMGEFVVIEINSEDAIVRPTPEDALRDAQQKYPKGIFHLIKVGSPGVYRVGYSAVGGGRGDWVFGR